MTTISLRRRVAAWRPLLNVYASATVLHVLWAGIPLSHGAILSPRFVLTQLSALLLMWLFFAWVSAATAASLRRQAALDAARERSAS